MRHTRHATKSTTATLAVKFRNAMRYRGLFARVARELKLGKNGRSHVRRVALGERRSTRVEIALIQAVRLVERKAA